MNTKSTMVLALIAASLATAAVAQQAGTSETPVVTSEPGRVKAVSTAEITAKVAAVDKATRTVTLQPPSGDAVDVVAPPEVRNFDQIKPGDTLAVRYRQALELALRKTKTANEDVSVREEAQRAKLGERPSAAHQRQISAVAEVTAVDPGKKTITLKGPQGNVAVLDVNNPDQFKAVHVGDQVDVTYTEAVAVSVEPGDATQPKEGK